MKVLPLSEALASRWDQFVMSSNDTWLFHLSDWIAVESAWDRSVSFLVEVDGEILGIFPLYLGHSRYGGLVTVRTLHTGRARSGPAVASHLGQKRQRVLHQEMFQHADFLAGSHRAARLEVRLPSLAPASLPPLRKHADPLSQFGSFGPLRHGRSLDRPVVNSKIVHLEKTLEVLWAELDDDCRKAIRKAKRSGLEVTNACSEADVADYHRLHVANYRHTGAGALPLEHFLKLWTTFHDRGLLHILFAEEKGRRVAGLIMLTFRGAATYWAGSSARDSQHLRPNNLLMWEAIVAARSLGLQWFEVGPTFPFAPAESKPQRIGRFKDQFGGEYFRLYEGAKSYRPLKVASLEIMDSIVARVVHLRKARER